MKKEKFICVQCHMETKEDTLVCDRCNKGMTGWQKPKRLVRKSTILKEKNRSILRQNE